MEPVKKTARPSERCDFQTTCLHGSSCVLGTCECPPGYSPSLDLASCVNSILIPQNNARAAALTAPRLQLHEYQTFDHLGSKCTLHEDCKRGAQCLFNVCACPPHTIANSTEHCVPDNHTVRVERRERKMIGKVQGLPGVRCDYTSIFNPCNMGAQCKNLHENDHFCVCPNRMVTNSGGYCTSKLLADTKKSK